MPRAIWRTVVEDSKSKAAKPEERRKVVVGAADDIEAAIRGAKKLHPGARVTQAVLLDDIEFDETGEAKK